MKNTLINKYYVIPTPDLNIGVTKAPVNSYSEWVDTPFARYKASLFDTRAEAIEQALQRVDEWIRETKKEVEFARKEYASEKAILAKTIKLRKKVKEGLKSSITPSLKN